MAARTTLKSFRYPEDAASQVAYACRILNRLGHSDAVWGHVSLRNPGEESFMMKPAGMGFEEPLPEDIIRLNFEGEVLAGNNPRHIEFPIHGEIMRSREDVMAVVHTHPVHSIAFAATGQQLKAVSHEGTLFCEPDISCFDETTDLIDTIARGQSVARKIGSHRAMFLRNHGIVTAGSSVMEAVAYAVLLEQAARVQLLASATGSPVASTPAAEVPVKRSKVYAPAQLETWWKYQCRMVGDL